MAMPPKRKQRLQIVAAIVVGASVATSLLFYALSDNLNLFYPPSEIAQGKAPVAKRIRAGGMVKDQSVVRQADGLTVEFVITDYEADLRVRYTGILPDLFAENEGVVVAGVIDETGLMKADEVLAKHDENYMPPEVADTLKAKPVEAGEPGAVSQYQSQRALSIDDTAVEKLPISNDVFAKPLSDTAE